LKPIAKTQLGLVAFFDVDKTVTLEDTFLLLVRMRLKESPWRVLILLPLCPLFVLTFLFKFDRGYAKGAVLWSLTVGMGQKRAIAWLRSALALHANALWLPEAEAEIRDLEANGYSVVFVTASAPEWIVTLLEAKGFESRTLVGTRLREFLSGLCVAGANCYGDEKVRRIQETLESGFVSEKGYSDSAADLPMLRLCKERILVTPTKEHVRVYTTALGAHGFRIVNWRP
jgi:phosphatidylglycerophosphatase C